MSSVKTIAVLGSTGSIGTQTLDIIAEYPELFRAGALTARRQWQKLAEQALTFRPEMAVIGEEKFYQPLAEALAGSGIRVAAGPQAICEAAALPCVDTVVTAMVGYSGLLPTISAIKAGKTIALSNKETLVVAGELITRLSREHGADIVPVDSEHSAIFQCLQGESKAEMSKIILTASGGPFRTLSKERLDSVTPGDALKHPNWDMGAKVTIDSASMMNKGFEMIEARWLFDCPPERIEVVVHPQSIVHSMIEFTDGSVKAQMGCPDMRLPISYALGKTRRLPGAERPLTFAQMGTLTFEEPDYDKFPCLRLAYHALERGGNTSCVINAANEVAVSAFLHDRIRFTDIYSLISEALARMPYIAAPDYADYVATDSQTRILTKELVEKTIVNTL